MNLSSLAHDWRILDQAQASADFRARLAKGASRPAATGEAGGEQGGGAGLVTYKTSAHGVPASLDGIQISFEKERVRMTRVRSLRRNVWAAGKLHETNLGKRVRCWFVTLTYRGAKDWGPKHVSEALERFRHWCKGHGTKARYVWVAELQKRGAMHYHLAIWLPAHLSCPMWDKPTRKQAAFWPHGMTNRQLARNAVGYLMKYMSKVSPLHEFPKGARIYGAGGLEQEGRDIRSWLNLPTWIKQLHGVGEVCRKRGARMVRETGEILLSPFKRVFIPGGMFLQQLRELPDTWADGPYSRIPA